MQIYKKDYQKMPIYLLKITFQHNGLKLLRTEIKKSLKTQNEELINIFNDKIYLSLAVPVLLDIQ